MPTRTCVRYLLAAAVVFAIAGCSQDKHTFRSTVFRPTTVSIRNLVSQEVIWSKNVPVYHKLVMNLDRPGDITLMRFGKTPAHKMKWKLINEVTGATIAKDKVVLPGLPIMIEPTYRSGPELPAGHKPQEMRVDEVADAPLPAPDVSPPLPQVPDESPDEVPALEQDEAPVDDPVAAESAAEAPQETQTSTEATQEPRDIELPQDTPEDNPPSPAPDP